ncbi:MAG: hypothetical protein PHE78_01915, partial [Candidatus Gastranaerophilales bacterium]|nr:hypothetical protein [Candidatus Gastranaerophilales bacterium]
MITKVSRNEVLSRGQNQGISFANNAPSNTTGAANRKKNKMPNNQAVPADQFAKNHAKGQSSSSSNDTGVLLGGLGLLTGGAALILSLRKPGKGSGAVRNITEGGKPEATIHKALKELSESYEHHFKAPGDKDFTTMLQYQKDVALETRLQNYMTEALQAKKLTQHEANIGKLPDEVRAGLTALKLEAFNGTKLKIISGGQEKEVKAGEYIQNLASEKIYAPSIKPMGAPRNGQKHVIWMPTAEDYKITKHGGLADVPPQLAEAIAGNDLAMPVIISPMYKDEGTFVRRFADGTQIKYSAASFKQITAEDNTRYGSDLEKLMEFKMDVFTGNKNEKRKINMEVFQAIEKIKAEDGSEKEVKRILLSTDNSFD